MEERGMEAELVSIPATPKGLSTPETSVTPRGTVRGSARVKANWTPTGVASGMATPRLLSPSGSMGTPVKRVVVSLRGYLEEVGHLTRLNPQDAWLPITESRNGNAHYAAFHNLNAGIGFQALVLPVAFAFLGWYYVTSSLAGIFVFLNWLYFFRSWGIIYLMIAYLCNFTPSGYLLIFMKLSQAGDTIDMWSLHRLLLAEAPYSFVSGHEQAESPFSSPFFA